jgi:hypothetical protein
MAADGTFGVDPNTSMVSFFKSYSLYREISESKKDYFLELNFHYESLYIKNGKS